MIDNSKANLLTFREYVSSIKDGSFVSGDVTECYFVLMAFANCVHLKIVVLRPHLCSFVFTPLCEEAKDVNVFYLKHIPPRDYIAVRLLDEASDKQISNKDRFLENMDYPERLQDEAVESWRSTGYKHYLETLKSLLPKLLTGTEDTLDKVDGSPINRPVMSHITLLEEVGFGANEDELDEKEEEGSKEDDGSVNIK